MAESISVDFTPIENQLKSLDQGLKSLRDDMNKKINASLRSIEKNTNNHQKDIHAASFVISGAIILGIWATVKDNAQVQSALEGLKTALEQFGATMAPVFSFLINALTSVVNAFNALPEPMKYVLIVGALISGMLVGLMGIIAYVVSAWGALQAAMALAGGGLISVVGIIALVVAGVALLVAGLIYAYTHFEWFRNLVNTIWTSIQAGLSALWAVIQPALVAIADFFITQWQRVVTWWNTMLPTFMTIWNAIWAFLQPIIGLIVQLVQGSFENMKTVFIAVWEIIKAVIITVWEIIKAVISTAIQVVMSVISAFAYLLTGQWGKAWESVLNILKSIGAMIASVVGSLINGILSILSSLLGMVGGLFRNAWNSAWQITGQLLGGLVDLIWGKISGIGDRIRNFCSEAASWGANLITQFIAGIRSKIQGVINAVNDIIGPVKDFLGFSSPTKKGPGSQSHKWAPNFMEMFTAGIRMGIPALKSVTSQSISQLAVLGQSQGVGGSALVGGADSAPGIHIAQMNVRNDQDIRLISQELWRLHQRQVRSLGGRV